MVRGRLSHTPEGPPAVSVKPRLQAAAVVSVRPHWEGRTQPRTYVKFYKPRLKAAPPSPGPEEAPSCGRAPGPFRATSARLRGAGAQPSLAAAHRTAFSLLFSAYFHNTGAQAAACTPQPAPGPNELLYCTSGPGAGPGPGRAWPPAPRGRPARGPGPVRAPAPAAPPTHRSALRMRRPGPAPARPRGRERG